MIDSQMGKAKCDERSKAGSTQTGVPFVIIYHPKLEKIAHIMKKLEDLRINLLSKYLLHHQSFPTAVQENEVPIWFVLSFTF